jgi:hypothetical protein
MAIKFGLGIEKETGMVGYNDPLTDFDIQVRGRTGQYSHEENEGQQLGKWGWSTSDATVFSPSGDSGYEFVTKKYGLGKMPKQQIEGFVRETEKRAKQELTAQRTHKRTIPFGSAPTMNRQKYGSSVAGSYHFNITLPYNTEMTEAQLKEYKNKLKKGLLNVRAVQPLILAMTGSTSVDAIGNPKYLEGSLRQVYASRTSGIGYAKLGSEGSIFPAIDSSSRDSGRNATTTRQKWRTDLQNKYDNIGGSSYTDFRIKTFPGNHGVPTIEYRFLDTFDTRGTYSLLAFMTAVLANGQHTETFSDPAEEETWNEAMKSIAEEGWNAYLDIEYAKYLERKLQIHLNVPNTQRIRADILTEKVTEAIWQKNKEDMWVKTWIPEKKTPKIHNFSRDSWEFYFLYEIKNSPSIRNKLEKLLLTIDKMETHESSGKIRVMWDTKKRGYVLRDIILDTEVMGWEFGYEDVEDILHFLKRYHFLQLYTDDGGKIISVKKLWNSEAEMRALFDKMLQEKHMLNEQEGGLIDVDLSEITEEEEPVTPRVRRAEPEPEISESRTPPSSTTTETTGGVRVEIVTYPRNSDEATLLHDFGQVFSFAGFTYNDRNINVAVKYAHIKKGSQQINAFWKRTSSTNVILYVDDSFKQYLEMLHWVNKLHDDGMVSEENTVTTNIFVRGITIPQFFEKLREVVRLEYSKMGSQRIELSSAGIQRLKEKGIGIGSINNGKRYILINRERMKRFINKPRVLKNIPYYKDYYVEMRGMEITLKKGNTTIDKIIGETK